jgi:hypothetical protein
VGGVQVEDLKVGDEVVRAAGRHHHLPEKWVKNRVEYL